VRRLGQLLLLTALALLPGGPATAGSWPVPLAGGSALAATQALPVAPAPVASTCSLVSLQITVSWPAVPQAASYTVYQSISGAAGTYTAAATVTGTSWKSPVLVVGTYWYEVSATVGTSWTSPRSAATAPHSVTVFVCT